MTFLRIAALGVVAAGLMAHGAAATPSAFMPPRPQTLVIVPETIAGEAGRGTWTPSADLAGVNVLALAVDKARPSTVYAGTNHRGVLKTTDGGRTWRPSGVGQSVHSLAVDPETPMIYAGTWRRGIFKSTNGGRSWADAEARGTFALYGAGVLALAIDPQTPTTVYAGLESSGVFKSTDAGADWTEMNSGFERRKVHALAVDPRMPGTVYAATFREGYDYGSILKTTNGGRRWRELRQDNLRAATALAIDPRRPATVYAIIGGVVFKTEDGGGSWRSVSAGLGWYATAVTVDPRTSAVHVGTSRYTPSHPPRARGVFTSADGGRSWRPLGRGLAIRRPSGRGSWVPSVNALAWSSDGRTLYAATWGGGVFRYDRAR